MARTEEWSVSVLGGAGFYEQEYLYKMFHSYVLSQVKCDCNPPSTTQLEARL